MAPGHRLHPKAGAVRRLPRLVVEKPWGRDDIPSEYGDFGGRRIGEIWFAHPDGDTAPLMVKFLFTSERLSIQVHPDDDAAKAAGQARGKDECWLVLAAAPEAELGVGLTGATDRDMLRAAALDGSIVDLVDWRPAAKDDFVYNPAGTIHAIGAGLTVVEVQQNIDRTYRLYDYGRPRDLHLADGLAVARLGPVADARDRRIAPTADAKLVSGPYFHVLHLAGPTCPTAVADVSCEFMFVPLSAGCRAAGETVSLGEAVLADDVAVIEIEPGGRALLCWAA
jgi:mannose-6-phosphate isomerase